jgi:hypothetical protein
LERRIGSCNRAIAFREVRDSQGRRTDASGKSRHPGEGEQLGSRLSVRELDDAARNHRAGIECAAI